MMESFQKWNTFNSTPQTTTINNLQILHFITTLNQRCLSKSGKIIQKCVRLLPVSVFLTPTPPLHLFSFSFLDFFYLLWLWGDVKTTQREMQQLTNMIIILAKLVQSFAIWWSSFDEDIEIININIINNIMI